MICLRRGRQVENNMLALSRKKGEAIMVGNNVEISILDIKGDQIKIGIQAPKEIPVYRKEVYIQIEEENREAVLNSGIAMNNLKKFI